MNQELSLLAKLVLSSPYFWTNQTQREKLGEALLKCERYEDLKVRAKRAFDSAYQAMIQYMMAEEDFHERMNGFQGEERERFCSLCSQKPNATRHRCLECNEDHCEHYMTGVKCTFCHLMQQEEERQKNKPESNDD
jgi:hypothetical protein